MPDEATIRRASAALDAILNGLPIRTAAKLYDVNRSYLLRRSRGVPTYAEVRQQEQSLSPHLESALVFWVKTQCAIGYAPPLSQFRLFAQRLLQTHGLPPRIGKDWYRRFLLRNPDVRTARTHLIEYKRFNGACTENIHVFFDRLAEPTILKIPPQFIYNVDECGISEGMGHNGQVVADSSVDFVLRKDGNKRTWITIIECICANGTAIDPLIIFTGKSIQQQWYPDENHHRWASWKFWTSVNGWSSNEIGLKWLKELFIPNTKPTDPLQWRLLILDGHASHTSADFMGECFSNQIWLVFLPAHTSHVLQPLDMGVFSALKRFYRSCLTDIATRSLIVSPGKKEFLEAYVEARAIKMNEKNIKSGFSAAGIYPKDPSKPLNNRFTRMGAREHVTTPQNRPKTPPKLDFSAQVCPIDISTPKNYRQFMELSRKLVQLTPKSNRRALTYTLRKCAKAAETFGLQLTVSTHRTACLESALKSQKKTTRRRVLPDPNGAFITITQVAKVQASVTSPTADRGVEIIALESEDEASDASDGDEIIEDCITVSVN